MAEPPRSRAAGSRSPLDGDGGAAPRLGPYRLGEALPDLGGGELYLAVDTRADRPVALRLLPAETAADPGRLHRFRREQRLVADLDEPHLLPVHEAGVADGRPFVASRLVVGEQLGALLERGAPLAPDRAVELVGELAGALDAASAAGLTHGAVSPRTVLVAADGQAYLTELGTVPAPRRTDDVRALAAVLARCLTGALGEDDAALPALVDRAAPGPLAAVVRRALTGPPDDRFTSAGELAAAARAALTELPAEPARTPAAAAAATPDAACRRERGDRSWPTEAWLAVAVVAALVAVVAVVSLRERGPDAGLAGIAAVQTPPAPSPAGPRPPAASLAQPRLGPAVPVGRQVLSVAVAPDGRTAWVTDPAAGELVVVDAVTGRTLRHVPVPEAQPRLVSLSADGSRAYVSAYDDRHTVGRVDVVDTATGTVLHTVPVGRGPYGLAAPPDGRLLYVPLFDEPALDVVDPADGTVLRRVPGAANPHWIAFSPDGRLGYTANHFTDLVTVLDVATGATVTTIGVGDGPHALAMSPDGRQLAVVDYIAGDVTLVDTASNRVTATAHGVGEGSQHVAYAPDGRHLYTANGDDGTVSVVDTATAQVTARLTVGGSPTSVAVLPDGTGALVTDYDHGTLQLLTTG